MYTKKNLLVCLIVLVFSAGSIMAQSSASEAVDVTVNLQKGLSITPEGNLDFGERVIGTSNETITPSSPVYFLVSGHGNKSISVDYSNSVTLDDGSGNNLPFNITFEETGTNPTYSSGNVVGDGSNYTLDAASGQVYFWLSGSIDITPTTVPGDYSGQFTLDVAYN